MSQTSPRPEGVHRRDWVFMRRLHGRPSKITRYRAQLQIGRDESPGIASALTEEQSTGVSVSERLQQKFSLSKNRAADLQSHGVNLAEEHEFLNTEEEYSYLTEKSNRKIPPHTKRRCRAGTQR